jgi:hypothetical protein
MIRRLLGILVLLAVPSASLAHGEGGPFGLGIIIGEPTGISGKYRLSSRNAIDGAVAWSLGGDNDLHLHGDYLYHWYDVIEVKKGSLPLYAGLGGRVKFRENRDNEIGFRIPVGLNYLFHGAPFDAFVEIVPVLELAPDTEFNMEGAIGGRFYF